MSATKFCATPNGDIILAPLSGCVEAERPAVTAVESPVREAIATVRHEVVRRTEAGREVVSEAAAKTQRTIQATREGVQKITGGGKQRLRDIIGSAASYVNGAGDKSEDDGTTESRCYVARVRGVAEKYMRTGKKMLGDVRASAESCQHAVVEAVHNTVEHGRQRVEVYTTTAKDSVGHIVGTTRDIVNNSTKRFNETRETLSHHVTFCVGKVDSVRETVSVVAAESKPRLAAISATGRRALTERDVHLALVAFAQVIAGTLLLVNAVLEAALKLKHVRSFLECAQNFPCARKAWQTLDSANIRLTVERVPIVGHHVVVAATEFATEVKRNMGDHAHKE